MSLEPLRTFTLCYKTEVFRTVRNRLPHHPVVDETVWSLRRCGGGGRSCQEADCCVPDLLRLRAYPDQAL